MLGGGMAERRFGEVVNVPEIIEDVNGMVGKTVRVTGKVTDNLHYASLKTFDPATNLGLLHYASATLLIDATLLGILDKHSSKSLLQLIGELEEFEPVESKIIEEFPRHAGGGIVVLRARVLRNVDGLDTRAYEKAVKLRREFFEQRSQLFRD
ncbi:hypothetical protein HDU97_001503 [Phlyctochytrium planicorne]|nr:hypothetical protein HDU97_001503 [Phlyctochytrium planicorne]